MSADTIAEHTEPEPGRHDPILDAPGHAALERWLPHHAALGSAIEGMLRAHIHLQDLTRASKVAAPSGAMLRFAPTRSDARRRCLLAAVAAAGYLGLLELRTEFPTTPVGESLLAVLLQAAILITISAELVLCGSATSARPDSPAFSQSRAAARRALLDGAQTRVVQQKTAHPMQRYVGGLRHVLLRWAIGPAAPAGTDRAAWTAAFGRTIRRSFTAS